MGAWIEIKTDVGSQWRLFVAPPVGAWIEIVRYPCFSIGIPVAPPVGAWIEIITLRPDRSDNWSLPLWERGLKCTIFRDLLLYHPVAPPVGAWIEIT